MKWSEFATRIDLCQELSILKRRAFVIDLSDFFQQYCYLMILNEIRPYLDGHCRPNVNAEVFREFEQVFTIDP